MHFFKEMSQFYLFPIPGKSFAKVLHPLFLLIPPKVLFVFRRHGHSRCSTISFSSYIFCRANNFVSNISAPIRNIFLRSTKSNWKTPKVFLIFASNFPCPHYLLHPIDMYNVHGGTGNYPNFNSVAIIVEALASKDWPKQWDLASKQPNRKINE